MKYRTEEDAVGKMKIPANALYGINALRAKLNFPITKEKVQPGIIKGLLMIKEAAAITNYQAGTLSDEKCSAIKKACGELLSGKHAKSFIVPAIQGGAGTSANMNVNEVIANLATRLTDNRVKVGAHNDVNQCQSTNDTFPSSGKMAMLKLLPSLINQIEVMINQLDVKSKQYVDDVKVGRTQLQDAVPTTYGGTFKAYASMFKRDIDRLEKAEKDLSYLNLGGTAIGTGLTASKYYEHNIVKNVGLVSGLSVRKAPNLIDATQNCDVFVEFSSALKALAVNLSKMCNDFRLLSSGPQAGLNEFFLPKVQPGSSIMPDKINPVIPEVVNQVAFEAIGNDVTVTLCAEAGQLELNAFEPIMFRDILVSEKHLTRAIVTLVQHCISGIKVNTKMSKKQVENSACAATVLGPELGYDDTTELIKNALAKNVPVKTLAVKDHLLNKSEVDKLFSTHNLIHPIE